MTLRKDPDLSEGTLYLLAHDDSLGDTVGRRATIEDVSAWLTEQRIGRRVYWCTRHDHDTHGSSYPPGWICMEAQWRDNRWDCTPVECLLLFPDPEGIE